MEPTTVECSTACTVTIVHELSLPPLQLTVEEGGQIALAIVGVWAVAFGVRVAIQALRHTDKGMQDGE